MYIADLPAVAALVEKRSFPLAAAKLDCSEQDLRGWAEELLDCDLADEEAEDLLVEILVAVLESFPA